MKLKKTKISKRVRDEAARICSAKASDWASGGPLATACSSSDYTYDDNAASLASRAFMSVDISLYPSAMRWTLEWAEAEAMLRTGWTP